jgi:carbonic anhydrase
LSVASALLLIAVYASASEEEQGVKGEQALQKLMDGNARFASGNIEHPDQSAERMAEVVSAQHPFAVIVSCSDSRVPPEIIFDQGIGNIFVVRTAGGIVDDIAIGSIEYAVEHLGAPLVVVLGHDSCGAVKATVEGGEAPGHIGSLVEAIKPAVDEARNGNKNQDKLLDISIDNNIKNIVGDLNTSGPILSESVKGGKLKIVGARYHLDSGKVDLVDEKASAQVKNQFVKLSTAITAPRPGDILTGNKEFNFKSTVKGGKEPYTYSWTSNIDGHLSSEKSFRQDATELSKGGHTVTLIVTDSSGNSAQYNIRVRVM